MRGRMTAGKRGACSWLVGINEEVRRRMGIGGLEGAHNGLSGDDAVEVRATGSP